MVAVTPEEEIELLKNTKELKGERWHKSAVDIISIYGGKDKAMQSMMEHYGFKQEETMAFGDGGNDISMLQFAGIGVAMADGFPEAKEIADYITPPVAQDGIQSACEHFKLI